MTVAITQVNTASGGDVFTTLYNRFNQVANALSTVVLTAAANSSGGSTTGNSSLAGIFSATVMAPGSIRGGNVANSADLLVTSNLHVNGDVFYVGNSTVNSAINSTTIVVNTAIVANLQATTLNLTSSLTIGQGDIAYITKTTNSTSLVILDSFLLTAFRSAEYLLSIRDTSSNTAQVTKMLVVQDSVNAYMTEYGVIHPNGSLGTFAVSTNSTAVIVNFQPSTANVIVRAIRQGIKVA